MTWPERLYTNTKVSQDKQRNRDKPGKRSRHTFRRYQTASKKWNQGTGATKEDNGNDQGKRMELTSYLWVVPLISDYEAKSLYKSIEEVKKRIGENANRRINMISTEHTEDRYIRKCAEEVFHNTETHITIWNKRPQKANQEQTKKMILRTDEKEYASALGIRETVNLNSPGVELKNIKRQQIEMCF